MSTLQVTHDPATKTVMVQELGDALQAGFTKIGEIPHTELLDPLDVDNSELNHDDSTVIYHHVREMLYRIGILNMADVTISLDTAANLVTGISVAPAAVPLAPLGTSQLVITWTPANADDKRVVYTSSDDLVATVNATGLITAHAAGVATITATSDDGGHTDTCDVTVA